MNPSNLSTWRVLVVDDEPDSVEVVEMVLSAVGATVYQAFNGREGLATFRQMQPTLVLTDISMPEVDGWEVLKEIRKSKDSLSRTPVIALTAHAMAGDEDRVLAAGFNGYLSKPLRFTTLIEDLIACIDHTA